MSTPGMCVSTNRGLLLNWGIKVSNRANANKIACDFISIDNITETQKLVQEFWTQHLSTKHGDDVLNLYLTLYYAFTWLCQELNSRSEGNSVDNEEAPNLASYDCCPAGQSLALAMSCKHSRQTEGHNSTPRSVRRKEKRKAEQEKKKNLECVARYQAII